MRDVTSTAFDVRGFNSQSLTVQSNGPTLGSMPRPGLELVCSLKLLVFNKKNVQKIKINVLKTDFFLFNWNLYT